MVSEKNEVEKERRVKREDKMISRKAEVCRMIVSIGKFLLLTQ